jgi:site-specific recombinase XerD
MDKLLQEFTTWLITKGYKKRGIEEKLRAVKLYVQWAESTTTDIHTAGYESACAYREHLRLATKKDGTLRYTAGSINGHIAALRLFYSFLCGMNYTYSNPFLHIDKLREGRRLPKTILSAKQMKFLLDSISCKTVADIKFLLLAELLYGGAFRINELEQLHRSDIDTDKGIITIRDDKSRGERLSVLPEFANDLLHLYLTSIDTTSDYPFHQGKERTVNRWINARLKKLCKQLSLPPLRCHGFRHSAATHMLQNGADIRLVSEYLGHRTIRHTERYTHIYPETLGKVLQSYHPREQL